jgi:putative endonuclease
MRLHYVYILASRSGVLYVGVTNDLRRRLHEHRASKIGFTAEYHCHRLVYFEVITGGRRAALAREKQLKRRRRERKVALIEQRNPWWDDLGS